MKRSKLGWRLGYAGSLLCLGVTGGCATNAGDEAADALSEISVGSQLTRPLRAGAAGETLEKPGETADVDRNQTREIEIPGVSDVVDAADAGPPADIVRPPAAVDTVNAVTPAVPIPQFVDVVFGQMLGVPYVTGPGVAERTELVQLRSSGSMSADAFVELVSGALESYGISVFPEDGVYRIVEDSTLQARVPRFIRSRSRADIPAEMRPIVQFVELSAISSNEMEAILRQAFPDKQSLQIESNPRLDVITLTGLPEDVDAALVIVDQLDELAYAGSKAERYSPVFWAAPSLAQELAALLAAEGWQTSTDKAVQKTILVLPVEYSNDIFIFSRSPAGLSRARFWLSELDRPSRRGDEPQIYVYDVENVDAQLLAETVNRVLTGQAAATPPPTPAGEGEPVAPPAQAAGGRLVVDPLSNQLIYSGTPSEYDLLRPLLIQLDNPPAEVLIEVTIAELTLTDDTRSGVEFFIDSIGGSDFEATIANQGLGLGGAGTNIAIFTGNVEAAINFFAQNNLLDVLSTPRIVARSGGSAQIQVGSDVPVITSQRAADTQDGIGELDVLQSVDYRSTGVLLSIEPIVFGRNRVDLSITQEVSTAVATTTSAISSPTISNRSLTTQLSLEDGATVVLGGLIQNNVTYDETGVPLLKDAPVVGGLFRNTTLSQNRTELIALITAYVMRGSEDKKAFTDELVDRFQTTKSGIDDFSTYLGDN